MEPEIGPEKKIQLGFSHIYSIESLRQLKTNNLGKLIAVSGTVTKSTEVRPELIEGVFKCLACNTQSLPIEQQFRFTAPRLCVNPKCGNATKFELNVESSTFNDWQKLKLQEMASDLPSGATPRSVDIILRGEVVEKAQPGDRVIAVGTLIVIPEAYSVRNPGEKFEMAYGGVKRRPKVEQNMEGVTGLSSLGVKDLNFKLVFLVNNIMQVNVQNKL